MIKLEFKHEEPKRRLDILRNVFGQAAFGLNLSRRSKDILAHHPEWLQVDRGDYNRFYARARDLAIAIQRGAMATAQDLWEAIMEEYRPILHDRVGEDTGQLKDDISSANVVGRRL